MQRFATTGLTGLPMAVDLFIYGVIINKVVVRKHKALWLCHGQPCQMFDRLETLVQEYNKKHAEVGGKCFLQRYKNDGGYEQHLVLSICTPFMSHVHKTRQASEMAFMDSSGSLDRHNNPVFFMCTHHPCGALPLAVWVTSSQSEASLESCLERLKSILPSHAFGN